MDSYTPRARKDKGDIFGALNLKTRNIEEAQQISRARRTQSNLHDPIQKNQKKEAVQYDYSNEDFQSKGRKYSSRKEEPQLNSKYSYETKCEEDQSRPIIADDSRRQGRQLRENRDYRENRGLVGQGKEIKDYKQSIKQSVYIRRQRQSSQFQEQKPQGIYTSTYASHKRNEKLLRQNRDAVKNKENNGTNQRKQMVGQQNNRVMDKQLVEKLYTISKLNNRISEKLKNMSANFDKHR